MSRHSISDIQIAGTRRRLLRTVPCAMLAALAALPFAIAVAGLLRGGIEPYIVLAALALG